MSSQSCYKGVIITKRLFVLQKHALEHAEAMVREAKGRETKAERKK
jgi:hypothetical protein